MKYKSFEAAKIANPEEDIFKLNDGSFVTGSWIQKSNFGEYTFTLWHAKDYCLSLDLFFDSGKEFVADDKFIAVSGEVITITGDTVRFANMRSGVESECFILKAVALEESKEEESETPKRAKYAYVKVDCKRIAFWEVVKEYQSKMHIFWKYPDSTKVIQDLEQLVEQYRKNEIYHRIEIETTEREEFIEFIQTKFNNDKMFICNTIAEALFDAGCRFKEEV